LTGSAVSAPAGPLSGVRILDFTANMSGPFATMILGDQGADVIKIEPLGGDIIRYLGDASEDVSGYFGNLNRSKRSVAIDLTRPEAGPVLNALLGEADVVVHNYRPAVANKLGLDADTIRTANPLIIHAAITGFGSHGPYSHLPVYDHVIQALSGFAARQAVGGADPTMVRHGIIDKATGQAAAQAITAALFSRSTTGTGQTIEVRMIDVALAILWPDGMMNYTLLEPQQTEPDVSQSFRLTRTSDGHVSLILVTAARLKRLATAFDLEGAADLPDSGPMRKGGALMRSTAERIALMTTVEVIELLDSLDIPAAPVVTLDALHTHPQIVASGSIDEFDHPVMGRVRQANPAVRFNGERAGSLRAAPHLGQDTEVVLREAGLSRTDVAQLHTAGVIGGYMSAGSPERSTQP
jgi:crotonobetainyl-CoA:carnitine CoA-transferase CaiB-like acyl-CoA transferase